MAAAAFWGRWRSTAVMMSVALLATGCIVALVFRPGVREQRMGRRMLLQLHNPHLSSSMPGLMKNIVIDRVYFPKGRHDAGLAKVHGMVNGKYVEGTLRIQRTAAYDPKEGAWTGVSQQPLVADGHRYNRAVEKVVADSISSAMQDMLRTNGSAAQWAPNLPDGYLDPAQSIAQVVYRKAGQAIANVFAQENNAEQSSQQLRASGSPLHQRLLKRLIKRRAALSREGGSLRSLPMSSGTVGGCKCKLPFSYDAQNHHHCIRTDSERAWCFTEEECGSPSQLSQGEFWDFCEEPLTKTVKGCECEFPFAYRGDLQRECIDASRTFLYGKEAAPGEGPRGVWCKTRGHCGEGQFQVDPHTGTRAFWDRCDLPGPSAMGSGGGALTSLASAAGSGGPGEMCGATVGDLAKHRRAFEFSGECQAGLVCAWSCAREEFCPSCVGGNCKCAAQKQEGEVCGDGSDRPPAYSHYECASGKCLFACSDDSKECRDCNGGNCKCAAA